MIEKCFACDSEETLNYCAYCDEIFCEDCITDHEYDCEQAFYDDLDEDNEEDEETEEEGV